MAQELKLRVSCKPVNGRVRFSVFEVSTGERLGGGEAPDREAAVLLVLASYPEASSVFFQS